jgi:hypothetical protein
LFQIAVFANPVFLPLVHLDTVLKWQGRRAAASPAVKPPESLPHNDSTTLCARFTGADGAARRPCQGPCQDAPARKFRWTIPSARRISSAIMWTCAKCGEQVDDQFDTCWKCSTPKSVQPPVPAAPAAPAAAGAATPQWRLAYRMFRGTFATWEELFDEAAEFANGVGTDKVVNVSHSADRGNGVVVVWYLTTEAESQSDFPSGG